MSAGRALLSAIFSRTTLGILGIVLLGLALWFGGPYLALGDMRPLASTGARVLVMLLTLSFLLFWLLHWPVSIVGVTALCLLIWHGGALLRLGEYAPFATETARSVTIAVVVLFFGLYLLYRLWLALRANEALLQKILHPGKALRSGGGVSPAEEQLVEVRDVVRRALAQLRSLTSHLGGVRGLFLHSRFIYELPWYMVFGAPGTGKTTAILNSGLKFPLGEQGGRDGTLSLAGISGTRNCLWWFTNEAVLIDTAGRYATHESNADIDSAEWKGFLGLLRKYRPRAPLNGAILAVNVEDLAGRGSDERRQLAGQLRQRLRELQEELRIVFPVYVLVTKMDLLKGFQPYFHNLTPEGRGQVLGFTLPQHAKTRRGTTQGVEHTMRSLCEGELRLLRQRLEQGLDLRLREEYDQDKRRQLYCLPSEFDGLCQPLLQLLDDIFVEESSGARRTSGGSASCQTLRGVYFTSAVQQEGELCAEPNTFLQRVGHLVRRGQNMLHASSGNTAFTPLGASRPLIDSRSYFLQQVLRKVIFPESFLVQRNRRWEARFVLGRTLGHAVVLLSALGLGLILLTSERNNAALLQDMTQRTTALHENMRLLREGPREGTQEGQNLNLIPRIVHEACSLTAYSDLTLTAPPLAYGAGLFAAGPAALEANALCTSVRRQLLLPPLTKILEETLRTRMDALRVAQNGARPKVQGAPLDAEQDAKLSAAQRLYEALHRYAALHDAPHFDAEFILRAVQADMAENGNNFFNRHSVLQEHVWTMLGEPTFRHGGAVDEALVTEARTALQGMGKAQRLYLLARHQMSTLSSGALPAGVEDFIPAQATGDLTTLYRDDGVSLATPIPALFTYAGYHKLLEPQLPRFLTTAAALDSWLMGEATAPQSEQHNGAEQKRLLRAVRKLYFAEYRAQWEGLINAVRLNLGPTPDRTLQLLGELGSNASLLDKLGRAVVLETSLTAREPLHLEGMPAVGGLASKTEKADKALKAASAFNPADLDVTLLVDKPFEALRAAVTGSPRTENTRALPESPVLKDIHALFAEYALHMQETFKSEQTRALPAPSDIADRLRAKARQLPPFYSTALEGLAEQGSKQAGAARARAMNTIMDAQVSEPCRKLVRNAYPFVRQGRDADPVAFATVFGPGGVLDAYFTEHLAKMVDTSVSPWQYTSPAEGAPDLAPFEQAARIREALFRNGGGGEAGGGRASGGGQTGWALEYHMEITELDARIERFTFTVNDKQWHYAHGPSEIISLVWSGAAPKATVEFSFRPRLGIRPVRLSGPWALLRLMEMGVRTQGEIPGQQWVEFDLDGYRLAFEVQAPETMPLTTDMFESFQCPQGTP